jgi:hypothetical protein
LFKKIEIWILYLTILFGILFTVGFGALVRQELVGSVKVGWASKTALTLAEMPLYIKMLGINEVSITDVYKESRFPNLDGFNGTPNVEKSYLLLSTYDGDLKEGIVELVDLKDFEVLHTWNPDLDAFNEQVQQIDDFKYISRDHNEKRELLRHPKLTQDGGLLFPSMPLRKIDACSDLIFQNTRDHFHHSIETDIDGNIWIPTELYPKSLPFYKVGGDLIQEGGWNDTAIVKLSSDGRILYEKSVAQIFIDNGLEYLLFATGDGHFDLDPVHVNDIQPVNYDGEFWKKGDVFVSIRSQSMIILYRPLTNKIIWQGTGPFFQQHDVDILDHHRISIFNNNSKDLINGNIVDGHNEVLIYDFKLDEYSSYLKDSLIENDVRTWTQGRSQILPNGDLFIEETNYGRTLYFNVDGSLNWTHVNRAEDGDVYRVGWSRILYSQEDIQIVNNFLDNKGICSE